MSAKDGKFSVSVVDRIAELLGEFPMVTEKSSFTYSFDHGYERLIRKDGGGGGESIFQGSYHPDVVCETGTSDYQGICVWCGRTLM